MKHVYSNWKVEPQMKRLMSNEEFRQALWNAWENGAVEGYINSIQEDGRPYAVDFEEWYDATYGGPDCE